MEEKKYEGAVGVYDGDGVPVYPGVLVHDFRHIDLGL